MGVAETENETEGEPEKHCVGVESDGVSDAWDDGVMGDMEGIDEGDGV